MFKRLLMVTMLFSVLLAPVAMASPVAAWDPFGLVRDEKCDRAPDTTVCQAGNSNPITGPNGIIVQVTNLIAFIAGFAAVIFLVLSGIKYITSNGDPAEVSKAKESIIYALVGLSLIVVARSVVGLIIGRI